jgi:hypothetical protein
LETGREAELEMQQPESDGWFVRQGRKAGRRRKPQVGWKAAPKGSTDDESRRLGSKANRKVERRRKPEVSRKVELEDGSKAQAGDELEGRPEDRQAARVAGRCEGWAGRLAGGASRRLAGRQAEGLVANASWRAIRGESKDLTFGKGR